MSAPSRSDELRAAIRALVAEYYEATWGEPDGASCPVRRGCPTAAASSAPEELDLLVDASLDFWLTYGRYSERFEAELAAYLGVRHCLLVNSGSSANLLAFMALTSEKLGERRMRRGDEVLTVAAGFPTTVAPIVQYGAVPVFVDVRADTANVDVLAPRGRCVPADTRRLPRAHARRSLRRRRRAGALRAARPLAHRGQLRRPRLAATAAASPAPSGTSPRRASTRRTT